MIFNCTSFFTLSAGHQLPSKAGFRNGEGESRRGKETCKGGIAFEICFCR